MSRSHDPNLTSAVKGTSRFDLDRLVEGVLAGDVSALSQSITLIESTVPNHRTLASELLKRLSVPEGKSTKLVAISGIPGAGKSSFIEALGNQLCDQDLRIAVLAVDPSSSLSGGSILGDKTRMDTLSRRDGCYIRPSPTGGALGGVTRRACETIKICEAAGFDVVLIETVGVGQSEIAVRSLVDCFVLLLVTGTGDDLQGIKKGIVEIADVVAINKADGDNRVAAETTRLAFEGVMHFQYESTPGWQPPVFAISARERRGVSGTWTAVESYFKHLEESGQLELRRRQNRVGWYRAHVAEELYNRLRSDSGVAGELLRLEESVANGEFDASVAVDLLVEQLFLPTGRYL